MRKLLRSIIHRLPGRVYAHLSEGLADVLTAAYHLHPRGKFLKTALTNLEHLCGQHRGCGPTHDGGLGRD